MVATQDPEFVGNPAQEQGQGPNQPDGVPPMRLDPTLEFPTVVLTHHAKWAPGEIWQMETFFHVTSLGWLVIMNHYDVWRFESLNANLPNTAML